MTTRKASIRFQPARRRTWAISSLAALGCVAAAAQAAAADPTATARTLQAGPVHTSVAIEAPNRSDRLPLTDVRLAEPAPRAPQAEPQAPNYTVSYPANYPAAPGQVPSRRELWAQDVVSGPAVATRASAIMPLVQASARQYLPPPEEVTSQPGGNASGLPPFDDDIKPLSATRTHLQPPPGEMPRDYAEEQFESTPVVFGGSLEDRRPTGLVYFWEASALCFQPIYIEDVNLERYGYSHGVLQPFVSAIHFFGTIPLLPYKMGMHPESECIYTLGYYRPGTPCPYQTSRLGWSWRGAVCEAAFIGAIIAWNPSGKFY